MAMGRRKDRRRDPIVSWAEMPRSPDHVFYDRLQSVLTEANFERFPVLKEKYKQITGELSGGQQRMVEIGRTLMAEPKMLLIDEPTAGLSKMLAEEVYETL